MANPDLSALVINCWDPETKPSHLHTDFFVVRPSVFKLENMPNRIMKGAENSFTYWVKDTVLNSHDPVNYMWVPGADPADRSSCRAGMGRDYFDTPVVHQHYLHPDMCTVPEPEKAYVEKVFENRKWPPNWNKNWKNPLAPSTAKTPVPNDARIKLRKLVHSTVKYRPWKVRAKYRRKWKIRHRPLRPTHRAH